MSISIKAIHATMTIVDAIPALRANQYADILVLDAQRMQLAREYAAADGRLLQRIRARLKNDGSGLWSRYTAATTIPGRRVSDHLHLADGRVATLPYVSFGATFDRIRDLYERACDEAYPAPYGEPNPDDPRGDSDNPFHWSR